MRTHAAPIERIYVVEIKRGESNKAKFELPRDVRVATQGDRFWVQMRGYRDWAWGRNDQGAIWMTLGPRRAVVVNQDEIGIPLRYIGDLYTLNFETLLQGFLKYCRLEMSEGSADTTIIVATPRRQWSNRPLQRAIIESPRINIEDLRFEAHRQEQLRAIMDLLKQSTRFSWEERYRDEYDRLCGFYINCAATGTGTGVAKAVGTTALTGLTASAANVSNKVLDGVYFKLVRAGAGVKAYGRENGRPVFGLVLSSEASYALQTEAGFRDDVRYNSAKVSDLIAPLGVEKAFRGFYHLVDDLAPRYTFGGGAYTRVNPYTLNTTTGVIEPNSAYDSASFEAAYVLHEEVMEALIPEPISGVAGLQFNPVNYKGDFRWTNIPNETTNPDGTIGFFRGILAAASKPIKTNFGHVVIFKRDVATPAA
jgi:hypothetical protein